MTSATASFSIRETSIFWISILVTFAMGVLAPRSLAFMPSIVAVGFIIYAYISNKEIIKPDKQEWIFTTFIIALAFISSLWAPDQGTSVERSLKIISVFVPGILLLAVTRKLSKPTFGLIYSAAAIYALLCLFLYIEKQSGHIILETVLGHDIKSHKLNRSFVVLVLFSIPLLAAIKNLELETKKKIFISSAVILLTTFSLSAAESQTSQLCFLVGLFFIYAFPANQKLFFKSLAALVLIMVLILPFIIGPLKDAIPQEMLVDGFLRQASVIHRLEVWNHAATQALNSPIYGNGVESLRFLKAENYMEFQEADTVLHAHNAVLQIWVEFGIIGALATILMLYYIFSSIQKIENRETKNLYLASFMTCLCCALIGYGLWQGWLLGLFFFIAAATIMMRQNSN